MMPIDDVITISSDDETNTEDGCGDSGLYNDRFDESLPSIAEISESVVRTDHVRRPNTENPHRVLDVAGYKRGRDSPATGQNSDQTATASPAPSILDIGGAINATSTKLPLVPTMPGSSDETAATHTQYAVNFCGSISKTINEHSPSPQQQARSETTADQSNALHCDAKDNRQRPSKSGNDNDLSFKRNNTLPFDNVAAGQGPIDPDETQGASKQGDRRTASARTPPQSDQAQFIAPKPTMDNAAISTDGTRGDEKWLNKPRYSGYERRRLRRQTRNDYTEEDRGDSDHEYMPTQERRKVARRSRRKQYAQRGHSSPRKMKLGDTKKQSKTRIKPAPADRDGGKHAAIASYEEWLLSNAVLKCVQDNGTATFQLQFAWTTTPCMVHSAQQDQELSLNDGRKTHQGLVSHEAGERECATPKEDSQSRVEDHRSPKQSGLPVKADIGGDIYQMECILALWGKKLVFLQWSDGTTGWEPRRNVLDKQMLREFEEKYEGFDDGVDALDARTKKGKRQYLLRWHGRPTSEDSWVDQKQLSPKRLELIWACGLDSARDNASR